MISKIICKISFKMNRLFFLLVLACIVISEISLIAIYPAINKNGGYSDFLKEMPQDMLTAIGMQGNLNNLNEYLNMNFYNSIYMYILMVFVVVMSARLSAKLLGDTSLAYFLNSSISRKKFMNSQIFVFNIELFLMTVCSVVSVLIGKLFLSEGVFELSSLLKINIELFALFMLIGSLCFCISVFVNNGYQAVAYSATFVVLLYITDVFRKLVKSMKILDYCTLFTVYDTDKITNNTTYFVVSSVVMIVSAISIYACSIYYFNKRDLYL